MQGDNYFSMKQNGKYLTFELGIELSIRDVQLIWALALRSLPLRRRDGPAQRAGGREKNKNTFKVLSISQIKI